MLNFGGIRMLLAVILIEEHQVVRLHMAHLTPLAPRCQG